MREVKPGTSIHRNTIRVEVGSLRYFSSGSSPQSAQDESHGWNAGAIGRAMDLLNCSRCSYTEDRAMVYA
jgi:hypothetical protein